MFLPLHFDLAARSTEKRHGESNRCHLRFIQWHLSGSFEGHRPPKNGLGELRHTSLLRLPTTPPPICCIPNQASHFSGCSKITRREKVDGPFELLKESSIQNLGGTHSKTKSQVSLKTHSNTQKPGPSFSLQNTKPEICALLPSGHARQLSLAEAWRSETFGVRVRELQGS